MFTIKDLLWLILSSRNREILGLVVFYLAFRLDRPSFPRISEISNWIETHDLRPRFVACQ